MYLPIYRAKLVLASMAKSGLPWKPDAKGKLYLHIMVGLSRIRIPSDLQQIENPEMTQDDLV